MKLRHKLLTVFAVPIVFQIAASSYLARFLVRLDTVAQKEINAKKVVSLCLEIQGVMGQSVLLISAEKFVNKTRSDAVKEKFRHRIDLDFAALKELVGENDKAIAIERQFEKDCGRFLDLWQELSDAVHLQRQKLYFSQFISQSEATESLTVALNQVRTDTTQLVNIYQPVADDLQPQAVRARDDIGFAVIATIAIGVVLASVILLGLNRDTLNRLKMLMQNMHEFSKGAPVGRRLTGNDELADLDRAFAEIAHERNRLEDIRKSMRAMVSHDLRSPLTSMSLRIELLLDVDEEVPVPETVRTELQYLDSELQRLNRLANTLLDIEKIEDGNLDVELERIEVAEIVNRSIDAVKAQAQWQDISIKASVTENIECLADRDRIVQVLVNLLSNAIKFAPARSTIDVIASRSGQKVRVEVLDAGPGVPVEAATKLFGKFTQLDQPVDIRKQGSGLGLDICKTLVDAQHGQVGYSPRVEGGSCFWFELPGC